MADTRRLDGVVLTVDGGPLAPELYPQLALVRVEESVQLPDYFALYFDDPHFELFDKGTFSIGTRVEIAFRAEGDPVVVTTGEITAISIEPGASGRHELVLAGFDLTHRMARVAKSRSFQRVTDADIASRIAGEYGLDAEVDATGSAHDYVLQAGETDYAFLRRRAARIGFDVWVNEKTFFFKKAPKAAITPPKLTYGKNLSRFTVRFSAAERGDEVEIRGWDQLGKTAITGRADQAEPGTDAPAAQEFTDAARRAFGRVKRNAGQFPVTDQAEADALAASLLLRASGEEVVLRGEAAGDPLIAAGAKVRIEGIGSRMTGDYRVTGVEHTYGATKPYLTKFVCGGKQPGALADLTGGTATLEKRGWSGLVVGIVTNNDDAERLGRVRVKFPTLSQDDESAWARIATPGGGKARGLQWIPEVDDEVLVGFELDDTTRPVVLGGLWNRQDVPPSPESVSGGVVKQRMLVSRKDSRLVFDDEKPEIQLTLGGTPCAVRLEKSESNLTGDQKLVVAATQIEIKATQKLLLSAAQIEITASGPITASGKPIKLN
ncbi:VgrG-related protein [Paractinoplanes rishiriensis]|uniref:Type IV secretion protein Rhs n=1 Tax=Paractinoplanes rishiriensis TaxID=1050105 RepID=A0A919JU22_9ACTN|nr:VgrG-related protein [Actinoplanes rishiriensis]GIE94783.1 type IV secretion protein Rhs [Actinoplanes rishiriensis]